MFGWLKKKVTEYTPTEEERRIVAAICNCGRKLALAYEFAAEPVRFEMASGIFVASLQNRTAGFEHFRALRVGYGVTVREALLSLLAAVDSRAVEQFTQDANSPSQPAESKWLPS